MSMPPKHLELACGTPVLVILIGGIGPHHAASGLYYVPPSLGSAWLRLHGDNVCTLIGILGPRKALLIGSFKTQDLINQ